MGIRDQEWEREKWKGVRGSRREGGWNILYSLVEGIRLDRAQTNRVTGATAAVSVNPTGPSYIPGVILLADRSYNSNRITRAFPLSRFVFFLFFLRCRIWFFWCFSPASSDFPSFPLPLSPPQPVSFFSSINSFWFLLFFSFILVLILWYSILR